LYIAGGIYLDIKTELVRPLQEIYDQLHHAGTLMATCLTEFSVGTAWYTWHRPCAYQGILFSPPGNAIFLECIAYMATYAWRGRVNYLAFCHNFAQRLRERCLTSPGVYPRSGWTLWAERVSFASSACGGQRQKSRVCSVIVDPTTDQTLFRTRFADFPWAPRR
jgi:hypothetical protein